MLTLLAGCGREIHSFPTVEPTHPAPGLADICGPQFDGHWVRVGGRADRIVAIDRYVESSGVGLLTDVCRKDVTLVELSWAFFAHGMHLLTGRDAELGVALIHLSADEYANPVAMAQLARIYFYGAYRMRLRNVDIEPNADRAIFYISAAYRVGQLDREQTGSAVVLSRVKNTGWMVTERLNAMTQKGEFDQRAALLSHKERILAVVDTHRSMYF